MQNHMYESGRLFKQMLPFPRTVEQTAKEYVRLHARFAGVRIMTI